MDFAHRLNDMEPTTNFGKYTITEVASFSDRNRTQVHTYANIITALIAFLLTLMHARTQSA